MANASQPTRATALREAAAICRAFAQAVREEDGPSSDEPEHDAAMACANLLDRHAARLEQG